MLLCIVSMHLILTIYFYNTSVCNNYYTLWPLAMGCTSRFLRPIYTVIIQCYHGATHTLCGNEFLCLSKTLWLVKNHMCSCVWVYINIHVYVNMNFLTIESTTSLRQQNWHSCTLFGMHRNPVLWVWSCYCHLHVYWGQEVCKASC